MPPNPIKEWWSTSAARRTYLKALRNYGGSRKAAFTLIHDFHVSWGGEPESASGPGSTTAATERIRAALPSLFDRYGVRQFIDAPCGDVNWIKAVVPAGVSYIGIDIVAALIEANRSKWPQARFYVTDIVTQRVPRADMVLCRDCLVHLRTHDAIAAIANFRASGTRLLLSTTFPGASNADLDRPGRWRQIDLQTAPFSLGEPLELIHEGWTERGSESKSLGLWRLNPD